MHIANVKLHGVHLKCLHLHTSNMLHCCCVQDCSSTSNKERNLSFLAPFFEDYNATALGYDGKNYWGCSSTLKYCPIFSYVSQSLIHLMLWLKFTWNQLATPYGLLLHFWLFWWDRPMWKACAVPQDLGFDHFKYHSQRF